MTNQELIDKARSLTAAEHLSNERQLIKQLADALEAMEQEKLLSRWT